MDIEKKALDWLKYHKKIDGGVETLIQHTSAGVVLWFYDENTLEDLDVFITVPMFFKLKEGKNIKKIKNLMKII